MMIAKIYVTLKNGVLDPQGKAVQHSLESIGYKEAQDVRIGKYIEVKLTDMPKAEANKKVKEMCEKMLANTVIENFRFEIE
ncbi:MAG: phosphoribosylformylglycinamidine synthase subunit PurS [Deltaproteobacteria bacterium]